MLLRELNLGDRALTDSHRGAVPATLVVLVAQRAFECANSGMSRMAVTHLAFNASEPIAEIGFN